MRKMQQRNGVSSARDSYGDRRPILCQKACRQRLFHTHG